MKKLLVSFKQLTSDLEEFSRTFKSKIALESGIANFLKEYEVYDVAVAKLVTSDDYKRKLLLSMDDICGVISKKKLPTRKVSDRKQAEPFELIIPKVELNTEGFTNQCEFLLSHCHFLIALYGEYWWYELEVKDDRLEGGRMPDGLVLGQITKELWIAFNALRLRNHYQRIQTGDNEEKELSAFISNLIREFKESFAGMQFLDELILPIGTQHHAMYLAFEKIDERMVSLRIDDLGLESTTYHKPLADLSDEKIPSYLVDVLPVDKLSMHSDYLVSLCQLKQIEASDHYIVKFELPKLYLHGQQKMSDLSIIEYPAYEKLTMGNCVVRNFSVGARIRNHDMLIDGEILYDWIFNQERQYLNVDIVKFHDAVKKRNKQLEVNFGLSSEDTTRILITKLRECYVQAKNAKLPNDFEDVNSPTDICDAYINLTFLGDREKKPGFQALNQPGSIDNSQINLLPLQQLFQPLEKSKKEDQTQQIPNAILIEGCPGIGKTILCQWLANTWANNTTKTEHHWWPNDTSVVIWIPLKNLAKYDSDKCGLGEVILGEYFGQTGPSDREYISAKQIEIDLAALGERVVLLLDGWGEMEIGQTKLIRSLIDNPHNHRIIVTSTPYDAKQITKKFSRYLEVFGYLDDNIEEHIRRYFSYDITFGNELFECIKSNADLWRVARIPANIVLLCVMWKTQHIQKNVFQTMNRTLLYSNMLLWLLRKAWLKRPVESRGDFEKREQILSSIGQSAVPIAKMDLVTLKSKARSITLNEFEKILPYYPVKLELLCKLAWLSQISNSVSISGAQVIQVLNEHYNTVLDDITAVAIIASIKEIGIFDSQYNAVDFEIRNSILYFTQITFQEYFAAKNWVRLFCSSSKNEIDIAERYFKEFKYNPRFESVWIFVVGLLRDNQEKLDMFFELMEMNPIDLLTVQHAIMLVSYMDESNLKANNKYKKTFFVLLSSLLNYGLSLHKGKLLNSLFICLGRHKLIFSQPEIVNTLIAILNKKELLGYYLEQLVIAEELPLQVVLFIGTYLSDPDLEIQKLAINVISQQPNLPDKLIDVIYSLLIKDSRVDVKDAALRALSRKPELLEKLTSFVLDHIQEINSLTSTASVSVLARKADHDPSVLRRLSDILLQSSNSFTKLAVFDVLRRQSNLPVSHMITMARLIQDPDPRIQGFAVRNISELINIPNEVWDVITPFLKHDDPTLRVAAIRLYGVHPDKSERSSKIISCLEDFVSEVKITAIKMLRQDLTEPILEYIAKLFLDNDPYVKIAVLEIFCRDYSIPQQYLSCVISLLEHQNSDIKVATINALYFLFNLPPEILECIVKLLDDPSPKVKIAVIRVLGSLPHIEGEHFKFILNLLDNNDQNVCIAVVELLGRLPNLLSEYLDKVRVLLERKNSELTCSIVKLLGKQKSLSDILVCDMCKLLQDPDSMVSHEVSKVLCKNSALPESALLDIKQFISKPISKNIDDVLAVLGSQKKLPEDISAIIRKLVLETDDYHLSDIVKVLNIHGWTVDDIKQYNELLKVDGRLKDRVTRIIKNIPLLVLLNLITKLDIKLISPEFYNIVIEIALSENIPIYFSDRLELCIGNVTRILFQHEEETNEFIIQINRALIHLTGIDNLFKPGIRSNIDYLKEIGFYKPKKQNEIGDEGIALTNSKNHQKCVIL